MAYVSLIRERTKRGAHWKVLMYACDKCRQEYEFKKSRSAEQLVADGCAVVVAAGEIRSVTCPACIAHERSMFRGIE